MVLNYLRRAYSSFLAYIFEVPPRFMAFLFLILLACLPLTGLRSHYLGMLIDAGVMAIFAASWDLLVGRTGQISLGHALFFGVGGYVSALLFKFFQLPIWVSIPMAIFFGAFLGLVIGIPCLRVKGPYLALVTMIFPLILYNLVKWAPLSDIFGGEFGIRGLPSFFPFLSITNQRIAEYYLTLCILFISAVILYKIANSKIGLVFVSIMDDEVACKACGINVTRYKLMAFLISGVFASLSGCVYTHLLKIANPPMLMLTMSIIPIIITYLGGIGTIYGPIVGAYIYLLLDRLILSISLPKLLDYLNAGVHFDIGTAKLLIFSAIVIILILKWPRGIARFVTDKLKDLEEARDIDERGPRIWKKYKKNINYDRGGHYGST